MAFLTDPSISQQVKVPNLAQVYLQAQQIKGAQQEQQLRSLSLAQATQAMKDEEDVRAAYASPDPIAALKQTNPKAAAGLQIQLDKQAADKAKSAGEQRKTDLENNLKKVQGLGQLAGAATPENWGQIKQAAVTQFGADPNSIPDQFDPNVVKQYQQQSLTAEQQITTALQQHNAEETARHNAQTEATAAATQAETVKNHGIEAKQRQQQLGIEGGRLAVERGRFQQEQQYLPSAGAGQTGDAFLQSLNPNIASQIKAIAEGDIKMPPARSGQGLALRNAVLNYDPTFTDSRYDTKQNFKTKGDSQQVEGLATALEHLTKAQTNSEQVGFAPLLGHNATQADAKYNKDIQLYTEEVGKLIKGGVVTKEELHDLQSGLNSSRQGIRDASIGELTDLLNGKIKAKFQKYKAGTGQDLPVDKFFDKTTQQRLASINGGGGTIRARDPQGQLHEAPAGTPLPQGWKAE
jgi:hypothetical protein